MFSFGANQNNSNNNNNNQTFGTFSTNNNNNNQPNAFGQQSSFQPQQKQPDPIERLTRVSDLPNDSQNLIEQLNQHIQQQISISDQFVLNEESLAQTVESVSADVAEIQRRWGSTNSFLLNDQALLEGLRDEVQADAENVLISTRFMDGIRNGSLNVRGSADHILKYFFESVSSIEADIQIYDKFVTAIEKHVLYAKDQRSSQDAATLVATLKTQHEAFMRVASKVSIVHDRATQSVQ